MASVKYGMIITEIKGGIQGTVLQAGNTGKIMRNKGYNASRGFTRKNDQNNVIASVAGSWRGLSRIQQDAWTTAAVNWPMTDKFGDAYTPSGYQMFVAYNSALITIGEATVITPGVPPASIVVPDAVLDLDVSDGFEVQLSGGTADLDWIVTTFASGPVSNGRNGRNLPMAFMNTYAYVDPTAITFGFEWESRYGLYPSGGNVAVRLVWRNKFFPYPYYTTDLYSTIVP